jgi:diguanylate cyclase (GGDEF)-like protein
MDIARMHALQLSEPSWWSAGVIGALAITGLAAVACSLFLHSRIARRTRELEAELARRRRIEAELKATQEELEIRVRERTRALEARNEQLLRLKLALETANQRLRRLVAVDALTGIANRRCFDRALDREVRRARRDGQPLSLVFLDLDHFKGFNDAHGHARGDDVLRLIAQTLDETFRRGGDLVARYGGEEFAIVLPGVDGRRAGLYAERLRRRIWRLAIPYNDSQVTDRVTISAGVATVAPPMIATPDDLLSAADKALYRAKCLGRNRVASAGVDSAQAQLVGIAS